ncbi:MAG: NYN domain-containing protein [Chloroflexi bacterium]|nr:NYN domain-containing protein [Chloroflexota bacterium]
MKAIDKSGAAWYSLAPSCPKAATHKNRHLFSGDPEMEPLSPVDPTPPVTALYADIENFQDDGQQILKSLIDGWPPTAPKLDVVHLYVRADQTALWSLWATRNLSELQVKVKGVQHHGSASKNSADIAIAVDAITDLLLQRVTFVVLFSDDSDFMAVCTKLLEEKETIRRHNGLPPFLWVLTDRDGTRSATIPKYFPPEFLHTVHLPPKQEPKRIETPPKKPSNTILTTESDLNEEIARAVIENIHEGSFKSTDCQPLIKKNWPQDPLAKLEGPAFGTEFANRIWPKLQRNGVTLKGSKPRRYEMSKSAKAAIQ